MLKSVHTGRDMYDIKSSRVVVYKTAVIACGSLPWIAQRSR
jgi:hypothetical protein